jgi:DNA-binding CsgD family transcriptional regulator
VTGLDARAALRLIDLIYEAAVRPAGWTGFLDAYEDALDGVAACIHVTTRWHASWAVVSSRTSPETLRLAAEHVGKNPCMQRVSAMPVGVPVLSTDIVPYDEIMRSEWQRDVGSPCRFAPGLGLILAWLGEDLFASMTVAGSLDRPPVGPEHVEFTKLLVPHLQKAVQVFVRLSAAEAERDAVVSTLDSLLTPVVILASDSRILRVNPAAERLLAARDGLRREGEGLRTDSARETDALRLAVAAAARSGGHRGYHAGGVLTFSRGFGRRPLAGLVVPIAAVLPTVTAPAASVALFVTDPERVIEPSPELLRQLYGLTPKEADVALLLAQGRAPKEAAVDLGVRYVTVRNHLREVYAKTGTRRQAELVKLLLTGFPAIDPRS